MLVDGPLVAFVATTRHDEASSRGVVFERVGEWMQQDAQGVWTAPGGAQVPWFKDPDGNTLSITQM